MENCKIIEFETLKDYTLQKIYCIILLQKIFFLLQPFLCPRNVQTVPRIVRELKDIRSCDGDCVTFECQVEATPPPDIRWEKRGKVKNLDTTIGKFVSRLKTPRAFLICVCLFPANTSRRRFYHRIRRGNRQTENRKGIWRG